MELSASDSVQEAEPRQEAMTWVATARDGELLLVQTV
jgi:hypothetical protein